MKGLASAVFTLALLALPSPPAQAAVTNASSTIYFDANGIMVGQQITWCTSDLSHAGNVYTPYKIFLSWDCKAGAPAGSHAYPGTVINQYTLPPGTSVANACTQMEGFCEGVYGVDQIPGTGWTYSSGSGYDQNGNPSN